MCCWFFASRSRSGYALSGLSCCVPMLLFVAVCSLFNPIVCVSATNEVGNEEQAPLWHNACCGVVACGADCRIVWVVEEVRNFPKFELILNYFFNFKG